MRRTKQIKRKEVIFEPEEWTKIENSAKSLEITTSEYIRRMTLTGQVVQIDMKGLAPLVNGMRTISNNINQIARKANETNSIHTIDVTNLQEDYTSLCRSLSQFLSTLQFRRA